MKKFLSLILAGIMALCCTPALAGYTITPYVNVLEENALRYAEYARDNPDLPYKDVVVAVNLKLDEENYQNIIISRHPESLTVLLSKHYAIDKDYRPDNLVTIDSKYGSGIQLRADCYDAFLEMAAAMEAEGLVPYIHSGYRINTKRGGPDSLWYAWPGHSEHQTGLAFDLKRKGHNYDTLGEHKYQRTDEYAWLCENAWRYGFVHSFPKDKSSVTGFGFEPWHWRYTGKDISTAMKANGYDTYYEYWADRMLGITVTAYGEPIHTPAGRTDEEIFSEYGCM
ncbi:MAG: M15 family metallopeptidase [Clostridia bacterium]|nr:M15 family metallopeptidase [Clostridia bacterium]